MHQSETGWRSNTTEQGRRRDEWWCLAGGLRVEGPQAPINDMRVLHVVASVSERSGGPTEAVFGMSRSIQELGHQATIYTTNLDGPQRLSTLSPKVTDVPVD